MGFTTGFTGGVTLTLSIAYLTVLAHQRNRERQAAILRQQTILVSGLTDALPPTLPPTRAEIAAAQRANLVETAKDRWNAEVEGAVNWVQRKNWTEAREDAETVVARLWAKAFGEAQLDVEKTERKSEAVAREAKQDVTKVAADAKKAVQRTESIAGEKASSVAAATKSAYADAKAQGSEVVSKGEEKAEEAKGSVFLAIGKSISRGKEALGIAFTKAVEIEQEIEGKVEEEFAPVERTLLQRYEQSTPLKSVEETLEERYMPVDKRDNAVLRGL